jgi:methyltransferase
VTAAEILLVLVVAQRAAELLLSSHNTRRLKERGAIEIAARHYPVMVAVHASWLVSLFVLGHDRSLNMFALAVYLALQGFRFWVMRTTRIIVLPGAPLVSAGPYRYLSHPNYAVVAGEVATLPLVLGLPWIAIVFTVLNAAVLFIRIRAENRALQSARAATSPAAP